MNFFFSRAQLRRRSLMPVQERKWLAARSADGEAELDHALLWTLFPGDARAARDFVFRREQLRGGGRTAVGYLLVSARRPVENALLSVECKPYEPCLTVGARLCFSLRANPVVSRKQEGKARRHDVLMDAKKRVAKPDERKRQMDAAALSWLLGRASRWGLTIEAETVRMDGYRQMALTRKGRAAGFSSLDYNGLATVTDAGLLRTALTVGVGHARSYGCGLLLVKRLR